MLSQAPWLYGRLGSEAAAVGESLGQPSNEMFFKTKRCTDTILLVRPDVYVKGGDYTLKSLDDSERSALEKVGADIRFAPNPDPITTSDILAKIRKSNNANIV